MSFRVLARMALVFLVAAPLSAAPATDLSGEWELMITLFGNPLAYRMEVKVDGGKLTGSVSRGKPTPITGTVQGDRVRFEWKDPWGTLNQLEGRLEKGELSGTASFSGESPGLTPPMPWRARRAATDKPAAPRTLDFEPKEFHRVFSSTIEPVLRIWPGDTVRTWTVDAGGVDAKGQTRIIGGNPQTGPFYVEGAMPGDLLVVRVKKLKLNRATAISDDGLVSRAITADWASEHKQEWNDVIWSLDLQTGLAKSRETTRSPRVSRRPDAPDARLRRRRARLLPPGDGNDRQRADRRQHGLQRDRRGLDRLSARRPARRAPLRRRRPRDPGRRRAQRQRARDLHGRRVLGGARFAPKSIPGPRVENAEYLMAMGLAGSLDDAFKEATSSLLTWLESDYGLTGPKSRCSSASPSSTRSPRSPTATPASWRRSRRSTCRSRRNRIRGMKSRTSLAALALFVTGLAFGQTDESEMGTWKLNEGKSRFAAGATKYTTSSTRPPPTAW